MKVLYVSFIDVNAACDFGGAQGCMRNYAGLTKYHKVDTYIIKKKSNMASLLSVCERKMPPFRKSDELKILNAISK